MGRLLSALLILLLAFSHGALSAGVPHADGFAHAHVLIDDHHVDHGASPLLDADASSYDSAAPGDDESGKVPHGMGHHVHVVGDSVPSADFVFADRAFDREHRLPVDDPRLHSLALAPLPEPPSA